MGSANFSINHNAVLSGIAEDVSIGHALLKMDSGYVVATAANRATYDRRADGIALDAGEAEEAIRVAHDGLVDAVHSGLPIGAKGDSVIVAADGTLSRTASPGGSDDIIGICPGTNGDFHLKPGSSLPGGGADTGANLGSKAEVYKEKVGSEHRFRTLESEVANTVSTAAGKSLETKANTVAIRALPPGQYNAADFGTLDPTGVTDCKATIQSAINTAKSHALLYSGGAGWNVGGVVYLPPGNYRLSSQLLIDGSVTLRGAHGKGEWGSTNLVFDENLAIDALVKVKQTGASSTVGNFACIENVSIIQQRSAARDFRIVTAGIKVQANGVVLRDVHVSTIGGDGLVIGVAPNETDDAIEINANCFSIEGHCRIQQCDRYGLHVQGTNSSAGGINGTIDISYSGSWGLSNRSFLGNWHGAVHTASNGAFIQSGTTWFWRSSSTLSSHPPGMGVWSAAAVVPAGKPYLPTVANCPSPSFNAFIVVSSGGTTAGTEPDWTLLEAIGDTIVDGTVTWTAYAEIGGSVLTTGGNNRSTYGFIYSESDQNDAHAPDGAATFPAGSPFVMTPESRVRFGASLERVSPFTIGTYGRLTGGGTFQPLVLGVGSQSDPLEVASKSADYANATAVPGEWDYDWGRIRERWDIDELRYVQEWTYPQGPKTFRAWSQAGGRSLPMMGAVCWPSLWVGAVGEEMRVTALPAKAGAPFPDLTDFEGGGMFEQNDLVINKFKTGRSATPWAWRAKRRVATISDDPIAANGWVQLQYFHPGQVIQDGTGFWRCDVGGDSDITANKPAFVDSAGNTYTEAGGLVWTWAGTTGGTDADNWQPLLDGAPSVAMSALDVDWSTGNVFGKTLASGANAITFSNVADGQAISVRLTSHASGSTVTWPAGTKWPGGVAPTLTTPSGTDIFTFIRENGVTYGVPSQAFA